MKRFVKIARMALFLAYCVFEPLVHMGFILWHGSVREGMRRGGELGYRLNPDEDGGY